MTARRRVAITGIGLVTPAGSTPRRPGTGCMRRGAAPRRSRCSTRRASRRASRAEVKDLDRLPPLDDRKLLKYANRSHRFALAAADQAIADAGIRPTAQDREPLELRRRHRDDDGRLRRARVDPGPRGARRRAAADRLLDVPTANDPMAFARSQSTAGRVAAAAPLRHRRLRVERAHRLRVGRPGRRHRDAADPPRRRRPRADRRLRFDDLAGGPVRLLPAVGGLARQRRARAREPAVRPHPQRLRARRGRGLPRARGMGRAVRRGATIYAELAGDGNSLSSYRITDSHPSGDGPIQAMRRAIADAGATPRRRRLPQCARHVDADERPQRVRGGQRGVRRRREGASPSARPRA